MSIRGVKWYHVFKWQKVKAVNKYYDELIAKDEREYETLPTEFKKDGIRWHKDDWLFAGKTTANADRNSILRKIDKDYEAKYEPFKKVGGALLAFLKTIFVSVILPLIVAVGGTLITKTIIDKDIEKLEKRIEILEKQIER